MLEGLSFRNKNAFHNKKDQPLAALVQNPAVSKKLLEQKEKSSLGKRKIKNKQDRWEHIFDFAENYVTVLRSEIKSFYKENPEVYKTDCHKLKKKTAVWFFASLALLGLGPVGMPLLYSSGLLSKQIELFAIVFCLGLTTTAVWSLVHTMVFFSSWKDKCTFGSKDRDFGPWEFMGMFEDDANLLDLWEVKAKKRPGFDYDEMYGKKFKIKEKDLAKINHYLETSRWAQQWSRGELNNLHRVEWESLLGIVEKYEEFLTPVKQV